MNDALTQLEQQYVLLLTNFNDLLAKCTTDEQRAALRTALVTARRNYWGAINDTFHTDDPRIEKVVADLTKVNSDLDSKISSLKNVATAISLVESAVKVGSKLVALAG